MSARSTPSPSSGGAPAGGGSYEQGSSGADKTAQQGGPSMSKNVQQQAKKSTKRGGSTESDQASQKSIENMQKALDAFDKNNFGSARGYIHKAIVHMTDATRGGPPTTPDRALVVEDSDGAAPTPSRSTRSRSKKASSSTKDTGVV